MDENVDSLKCVKCTFPFFFFNINYQCMVSVFKRLVM